jgi:nitrate reductase alpha subunit
MYQITEIDCATGESITRDETVEETSAREQRIADAQAAEAERLAAEQALAALKASARAKLVAGEPLTEEEAATLVI